MNFNRKISVKNFNNLINYLLETTSSRIEITKSSPCYNEPINRHVIIIYCPQEKINVDHIKAKFNVHVAKWEIIIKPEGGSYRPGIDRYDKELERSSIFIELVK